MLQQPQGIAHHLARRGVAAFGHLILNEINHIARKTDVHGGHAFLQIYVISISRLAKFVNFPPADCLNADFAIGRIGCSRTSEFGYAVAGEIKKRRGNDQCAKARV